jgi:hypothetical protein
MKNGFPSMKEMKKNIESRLLNLIALVVFLLPLNPLMSFDDLIMADDISNLERKDTTSAPYTTVGHD